MASSSKVVYSYEKAETDQVMFAIYNTWNMTKIITLHICVYCYKLQNSAAEPLLVSKTILKLMHARRQ